MKNKKNILFTLLSVMTATSVIGAANQMTHSVPGPVALPTNQPGNLRQEIERNKKIVDIAKRCEELYVSFLVDVQKMTADINAFDLNNKDLEALKVVYRNNQNFNVDRIRIVSDSFIKRCEFIKADADNLHQLPDALASFLNIIPTEIDKKGNMLWDMYTNFFAYLQELCWFCTPILVNATPGETVYRWNVLNKELHMLYYDLSQGSNSAFFRLLSEVQSTKNDFEQLISEQEKQLIQQVEPTPVAVTTSAAAPTATVLLFPPLPPLPTIEGVSKTTRRRSNEADFLITSGCLSKDEIAGLSNAATNGAKKRLIIELSKKYGL